MTTVIIKGERIREEEDIINQDMKIEDFMDKHEIVFTPSALRVDGVTITENNMGKTFAELGVGERCYFTRSAKTDNN